MKQAGAHSTPCVATQNVATYSANDFKKLLIDGSKMKTGEKAASGFEKFARHFPHLHLLSDFRPTKKTNVLSDLCFIQFRQAAKMLNQLLTNSRTYGRSS